MTQGLGQKYEIEPVKTGVILAWTRAQVKKINGQIRSTYFISGKEEDN